MLTVDGSMGEGGGQILRTCLALSACLQRPFRITNIRAARRKPGLQPQHLTAVIAAAALSQAEVEGATKGSQQLAFSPHRVKAGHYQFDIGTAGSTSLVLQTLLPALIFADKSSTLIMQGGTHNPLAPTFDYLEKVFLPLLNRMGPTVTAILEQPGFAPEGGGRVRVDIQPTPSLMPLELYERGELVEHYAEVLLAHLPEHIAQRELTVIADSLGWPESALKYRKIESVNMPANIITCVIESKHITECFFEFGRRGLPAERVAGRVVNQVKHYLNAGVPVSHYLTDQLLIPLALAGGGAFITTEPSSHAITNMAVIKAFMQIEFQTEKLDHNVWKIGLS